MYRHVNQLNNTILAQVCLTLRYFLAHNIKISKKKIFKRFFLIKLYHQLSETDLYSIQ